MYGRTLLRDLMWKKQDLTTAETCCSMESSASKVTPSVFTTLENGMDASPTERQSTGTVSLLDDGPQRSTSVFCSLSFNLFFVVHIFFCRFNQWCVRLSAATANSGCHCQSQRLSRQCGQHWHNWCTSCSRNSINRQFMPVSLKPLRCDFVCFCW